MKLRAVALVAVLFACERRTPPAPIDAAAPASDAPFSVPDATPDVAAIDPPHDECGPLARKLKAAKSIGHTSIVYKVELDDGSKVAWKPNAKKVKERWRGEVAAFRLGRALGLSNVPAACPRAYGLAEVTAVLGRPALDDLIATDVVDGVIIPWIQGLQFLPLEKEPLRTEASSWLRDRAKPVPAEKADLAAQISSLVVFDFLTSNWDRYSGANVGLDATGKRVLFIDNDAAFMTQPPASHLRENQDAFTRTERFSRALYTSLRSIDDDARLRDAFGVGLDGTALLAPAVVASVRERVATAAAAIAKKIETRAEPDVLVFP